ncbi:isochorismatase family cysteine hydrolase [Clostridium botulinum]|uniref:Isochorismatase n=1 Tax=Clostridium botulinum TaxID=1491 RepID=A0A9Q1ZBS0_CLOBO|nr:isochorismatase family cysteine hydrolase [Clostridium botulinum]AEB76305.1 probable pyrazinamidase/nicotinamidase [Clostridium botulinum BKT015925]KEI04273.1 isochorismatase [Clostridium botulinum C/D str. Sp77]KLU75785.1 isochorismatase [Clostridium botulinum V891]KOA73144.1 isochorismatase [Clostridium botulinum]KOA74993.1 isochorismatase [Clostridium botulinum]
MKIDSLKSCMGSLKEIMDDMKNTKELDTKSFKNNKTALVIVDMINGFAKQGNLMSPRIKNIIPSVVNTTKICENSGFEILAFADAHTMDSIEFKNYPIHCLKGTFESQLIDELKEFKSIQVIEKNSTNGYMENEFKRWMKKNNNINNFIVIGNCTDICVMQFVLTLKSYFNKNNEEGNIFIPIDSVDTFDTKYHNGDLMNLLGLYNMKLNGIIIVTNIK